MYAKLNFTGNKYASEAVRDIVRLITDSNSGSASLSNLEFIDTATSELYAGVNSGWSLHSSTPLPSTGTAISATDSNFILQGTTATGSKAKYCGIHVNAQWNSTAGYQSSGTGVVVCGVLDPGTSTELWAAGYTSTNANPYAGLMCAMPVKGTIYLWADPTRIMILGYDYYSNFRLQGFLESTETDTTTWQNLPPVASIQLATGTAGTNNYRTSNKRGDSLWGNIETFPFINFNGASYCCSPGDEGVLRGAGWHAWSDPNYGFCIGVDRRIDDGTTNGALISSGYVQDDQNGYTWIVSHAQQFFGPMQYAAGWDDNVNRDETFGRAYSQAFNSSGSKGVPMFRLDWRMPPMINNDYYDFSAGSGIWRVPANLGGFGDTVVIDSDTYQYIPLGTGTLEAFLIKRT